MKGKREGKPTKYTEKHLNPFLYRLNFLKHRKENQEVGSLIFFYVLKYYFLSVYFYIGR
jgi:hypothetical protein